jgi:bifunctional non-homologous end joining protein LigD
MSLDVDGREIFTHACSMGLEGVVSKVRDSR